MKSLLTFEAEPFEAYAESGNAGQLSERGWRLESGWELETGVSYFNWDGVPEQVRELLARCKEPVAVAAAIQAGDPSLDHLSDLVFFSRHPERFVTPPDRDGRFISRTEPPTVYSALSQEWLEIRDKVVRPLLEEARRRPVVTIPISPVTTMADYIDLVACAERTLVLARIRFGSCRSYANCTMVPRSGPPRADGLASGATLSAAVKTSTP